MKDEQHELIQEYKSQLKILKDRFRVEIQARDREIEIYKEQINFLKKLIITISEKPITYNNNFEAKAMTDQSNPGNRNVNFNAPINGAGYVEGVSHYHASTEHKQSLAEAAEEIQRLLQQLNETNPFATEIEQITYVNVATRPDIKQRVMNALRAGGETALDEFILDNKYIKVGKAIIEAWLSEILE